MITSLMLVDRKYVLAKNIDSQLANGSRLSNLALSTERTRDLYGEALGYL